VVLIYPWQLMSPFYKDLIARGANVPVQLFVHDGDQKTIYYDKQNVEFRMSYDFPKKIPMPAFTGETVHYNMVILLAIILASPGLGWKRRIKFSLIGAGLLFVFHAFQVATKFENHFAHERGPYSEMYYSDFQRSLLEIGTRFFEVFGQQALPFAIWALLCAPIILKTLFKPKEEPLST
jgi:hypothetical protein